MQPLQNKIKTQLSIKNSIVSFNHTSCYSILAFGRVLDRLCQSTMVQWWGLVALVETGRLDNVSVSLAHPVSCRRILLFENFVGLFCTRALLTSGLR